MQESLWLPAPEIDGPHWFLEEGSSCPYVRNVQTDKTTGTKFVSDFYEELDMPVDFIKPKSLWLAIPEPTLPVGLV